MNKFQRMSDFRVVVTGSRDWVNPEPIHRRLAWAANLHPEKRMVLAHGDATGADAIADAWAKHYVVPCERFPVTKEEWASVGKSAGPKRNRRMLEAGCDLLLAFPFGGRDVSRGTWGCIEIAAQLGVLMVVTPMVRT